MSTSRSPLSPLETAAPTLPKAVLAKLEARQKALDAKRATRALVANEDAENVVAVVPTKAASAAPPRPAASLSKSSVVATVTKQTAVKTASAKTQKVPPFSPLPIAATVSAPSAPAVVKSAPVSKPRLSSLSKAAAGGGASVKRVEQALTPESIEQQTTGFTKWLNHMLVPNAEDTDVASTEAELVSRKAVAAAMTESATRRKAFSLLYRSGLEDVVRTVNNVCTSDMCVRVRACVSACVLTGLCVAAGNRLGSPRCSHGPRDPRRCGAT